MPPRQKRPSIDAETALLVCAAIQVLELLVQIVLK